MNDLQQIRQQACCLYDEQQVQSALNQMALAITEPLKTSHPVCLCVMTGGIIPTGHLLTRLHFPLQLDYIHLSRYHEKTHGNQLEWYQTPRSSLNQRTVLIIDDILDEGLTLQAVIDYCQHQQARKIYTAVLVDKQRPRAKGGLQQADFTGLTIADRYVFGYGLDYQSHWRNANGIYALP